jgi:uncharacterized protein YegP (UPF0339 family)
MEIRSKPDRAGFYLFSVKYDNSNLNKGRLYFSKENKTTGIYLKKKQNSSQNRIFELVILSRVIYWI